MTKKFDRALFVGRFQPVHLGHLNAIQRILEEASELIIVIGSSQKSHDLNNPFTTGERITMIRAALDEFKIEASKYFLIPIPDSTMHAIWAAKVMAYCPSFDVVYSNEPLTRCLFKEEGKIVKNIPMFYRKLYSATEIRNRLLDDGDWRELVPQSVVEVMDAINGIERLKELATTDSPFGKRPR